MPCADTGDELKAQVQGRNGDILRRREGKSNSPSGVISIHLDAGNQKVCGQIAGKGRGRIGERDGSIVQKVTVGVNDCLAELGFIQSSCCLYAGNAQ